MLVLFWDILWGLNVQKTVFAKLNVFLYYVQCFFYLICAWSEGWDIVRVINNYIILCLAVSTALRTGASIFNYPMYQNGGFHSGFELCVSKVSCLQKYMYFCIVLNGLFSFVVAVDQQRRQKHSTRKPLFMPLLWICELTYGFR